MLHYTIIFTIRFYYISADQIDANHSIFFLCSENRPCIHMASVVMWLVVLYLFVSNTMHRFHNTGWLPVIQAITVHMMVLYPKETINSSPPFGRNEYHIGQIILIILQIKLVILHIICHVTYYHISCWLYYIYWLYYNPYCSYVTYVRCIIYNSCFITWYIGNVSKWAI